MSLNTSFRPKGSVSLLINRVAEQRDGPNRKNHAVFVKNRASLLCFWPVGHPQTFGIKNDNGFSNYRALERLEIPD